MGYFLGQHNPSNYFALTNKGFLMSITALSVIDRINFLFDLCKVRAEKLS